MTRTPINLRVSDIVKYYKVDKGQAADIAESLVPCGQYGADALYSKKDVDKEIKKHGNP